MSQSNADTKSGKGLLNNIVGNNNLLDAVMAKLGLKNDAALLRALEVAPPGNSKIRHGRLPVGATLLIRMHEVTDIAIRELKAIATPTASEVAV